VWSHQAPPTTTDPPRRLARRHVMRECGLGTMSGMPCDASTGGWAEPGLPLRWPARRGRPGPPVGWVVTWAVMWGVLILLPALLSLPDVAQPFLATLLVLVAGGGYLVAVTRASRVGPRREPATEVALVVAALATAAAAAVPDLGWQGFPLLLAVALGAGGRGRWLPVALVTLPVVATIVDRGRGDFWAEAIWGVGLTTLLAGLLTLAFATLAEVFADLRRTRQDLARAAVAEERLRFSRDLHDLLGHTLSVIVVKAQATRLAAGQDPDEAARHAKDIERIGRDALGQVRDAVQGYRRTTLAEEVVVAAETLGSAGVRTDVVRHEADLGDDVDELLGWVVREGTTNVLRHAGARRATITTGTRDGMTTVTIEDDGRGPGDPELDSPGTGLTGLAERLAHVGGSLEAGPAAEGNRGFRLTACVPGQTDARAGGPGGAADGIPVEDG
jgi:two-component system sensor histidine kinase DesK